MDHGAGDGIWYNSPYFVFAMRGAQVQPLTEYSGDGR